MRRPGDRGEAGAAALEFALLFPLFLVLVFGAVDFGLAVQRQSQLNNAAREGAREAVFNPDAAQVEQVVRNAITGVDVTDVNVDVSCLTPDGAACGGSFDGSAESGGTVIVRLEYTNDFVTPAPSMIGLGTDIDIGTEVRMRIE